jgi:hypothetical protein
VGYCRTAGYYLFLPTGPRALLIMLCLSLREQLLTPALSALCPCWCQVDERRHGVVAYASQFISVEDLRRQIADTLASDKDTAHLVHKVPSASYLREVGTIGGQAVTLLLLLLLPGPAVSTAQHPCCYICALHWQVRLVCVAAPGEGGCRRGGRASCGWFHGTWQ